MAYSTLESANKWRDFVRWWGLSKPWINQSVMRLCQMTGFVLPLDQPMGERIWSNDGACPTLGSAKGWWEHQVMGLLHQPVGNESVGWWGLSSPWISQWVRKIQSAGGVFPTLLWISAVSQVLQRFCWGVFKASTSHGSHRTSPKGGRGCLMSHSCLESQGCDLIPLSYLLSCFFCPVLLLFLSCHFSANGPFSWLFSRKLSNIFC